MTAAVATWVKRCPFDHLADMAGELHLGQLLLGLRQPHIGEDVAAAIGHRDVGFSLSVHCS